MTGGAVLVGMHRGFMPFDGVMTLLTVVQRTGRVPRFLIHPGVGLRFPFLFDLMSKLGGIIASQLNADRILDSGELLAVYPEGIRGAFTMYKRAHRIGPSWRNDCIAFALRHQVPIVPFVTVGSAEIFPSSGGSTGAGGRNLRNGRSFRSRHRFRFPRSGTRCFSSRGCVARSRA